MINAPVLIIETRSVNDDIKDDFELWYTRVTHIRESNGLLMFSIDSVIEQERDSSKDSTVRGINESAAVASLPAPLKKMSVPIMFSIPVSNIVQWYMIMPYDSEEEEKYTGNETWKARYDEVISMVEENKANFLATIPNYVNALKKKL